MSTSSSEPRNRLLRDLDALGDEDPSDLIHGFQSALADLEVEETDVVNSLASALDELSNASDSCGDDGEIARASQDTHVGAQLVSLNAGGENSSRPEIMPAIHADVGQVVLCQAEAPADQLALLDETLFSVQNLDASSDWLVSLTQAAQSHRVQSDTDDAYRAASYFLETKKHLSNNTGESAHHGIDRNVWRELRLVSASLTFLYERAMWRNLEERLANPSSEEGNGVRRLVYVEFAAYDGVDVKVTLKKIFRRLCAATPSGAGPSAASGERHDNMLALQKFNRRVSQTSSGMSKLLQSEFGVGLGLQLADNRRINIKAVFLPLLLGMDHVNHKTLRASNLRLSPRTSNSDVFERKIRVASGDDATYNKLCEKSIMVDREGWSSWTIPCETHFLSSSHRRCSMLAYFDECGMMNNALCQQSFGMILKILKAAADVFAKMTVLHDDVTIDDEGIEFKQCCLDAFLEVGGDQMCKRVALTYIFPGDWRDQHEIQWKRLGGESREQVIELQIQYVVPLIFGHPPHEWPRQRFTGFEIALQDNGLPCCIHNIGMHTFLQFLKNLGEDALDGERRILMHRGHFPNHEFQAILDEHMDDNIASGEKNSATGIDFANIDLASKAKRGKTRVWQESQPYPRLLVLAIAFKALTVHQKSLIRFSGDAWQDGQWLQANNGDAAAQSFLGNREWPAVIAAENRLENRTSQLIQEAHASLARLSCLPAEHRSLTLNNLAFKVLSRAGARNHELKLRHRDPAFLLLHSLKHPESAFAEIKKRCAPSIVGWPKSFLDHYQGRESGEDAQQEAGLIATMARMTSIILENRNAQAKQVLTAMSLHVAEPSLESVDSAILLARSRDRTNRLARFLPAKAKKRTRPRKKHTDNETQRSRKPIAETRRFRVHRVAPMHRGRKGGGGLYRAFVSRCCKNVRRPPKFADIALLFKELPQATLDSMRDEAVSATLAHRAGCVGFGVRPWELERQQRANAKKARIDVLERLENHEANVGGAAVNEYFRQTSLEICERPSDIAAILKNTSSDARLFRNVRKRKLCDMRRELHNWIVGVGASSAMELIDTSVQQLQDHRMFLTSDTPGGPCRELKWACQPHKVLPKLVAAAKAQQTVFQRIRDKWEDMHRLIASNELEENLPEESKPNYLRKPECSFTQGICLCGEWGDGIWDFKLWLLRRMKSYFGGRTNVDLNHGNIVLRIIGERNLDTESDELTVGEFLRRPVECEHFLHISEILFNPYVFWMRRLEFSGASDSQHNLILNATHTYYALLEFISEVWLPQLSWAVSFYQIVDSDVPVASVDGMRVRVSKILEPKVDYSKY